MAVLAPSPIGPTNFVVVVHTDLLRTKWIGRSASPGMENFAGQSLPPPPSKPVAVLVWDWIGVSVEKSGEDKGYGG